MHLAKAQPLPIGPAADTPFKPVASSWIAGLRWTPEYGAEMTTKGGPRSYAYPGITKAMFKEWLSRQSKGKWWNRHVREAAAQFSRGDAGDMMHSWVAPNGQVHPTAGKNHGEAIQAHGFRGIDEAWKHGWGRVYYAGNKLYVHQEGTPVNEYQKNSLVNVAHKNGLDAVVHDYGDDERTLWSTSDQLSMQFSRWTGPVHPLFTPAADGPIDFGSFTKRDQILAWMKSRISPHATPEHLAALSGWLPGTKFHAYFTNKRPGQNVGDTLNTEVSDPHGMYVAHRTIDTHGNDRPALTNEVMHIPADGPSPYRGTSGPTLLRQMRAAYEMGIPAINFFAAYDEPPEQRTTTVRPGLQALFPGHDLTALLGPPQGEQQRFTGGLHWPLMGVDGILPGRYIKSVPREIVDSAQLHSRGAFLGSQRISDFFRSPEARDYYLGHPTSHEAMIDTTPGSYSRRAVERHVGEKAMTHGFAPPIPDNMMPKKPLHLNRQRYPFHIEHLIATGSLHPEFFDRYFCHYDPRQ